MDNHIQTAKPFLEAVTADFIQKIPASAQIQSEYAQEYRNFFQGYALSQSEIDQLMERLSQQDEIQYCEHQFQSQLRIQIVQQSPDRRIVKLKVCLGYFRVTLWVYNDRGQSPIHYCRNAQARENTLIYFASSQGVHEAIKCYELNSKQKPVEVFIRALKQCCFLKIASELGVGPKYTKFSQFDLIFFGHCIEFSMEQCCQINKTIKQVAEKQVGCLKYKLLVLHHFKMIHMDIKPGNIMYSRATRQPVFIDYGFSKTVQEEVRFKSLTQCAGSLEYCCPQMRVGLIGLQQTTRYIDLYFNDIHCLRASLREMQQQQTDRSFSQSLQEDINIFSTSKDYVEYYLILQIKKRLYLRQRVIGHPLYENILKKHHGQFFDFMVNLPYCIPLIEIHNFMAQKEVIKDSNRYNLPLLMKHKLMKMFKLQPPNVEADNLFQARLQLSSTVAETEFNIHGHARIVCFQDYKSKLSDPQRIKKLQKTQYYRMIFKCLDFRCSLSSMEERKNYAAIFADVQKIKNRANESEDSFGLISLVFRQICTHFIQKQEEEFETIVPATITNLVILEHYTKSQLLEIIKLVREVKTNSLKKAIMLFKCCQVLQWISLKIYSKYSDLKLELSISEILLEGLKDMKDTQYDWLARMIKDTICYDKQFSLEKSKELVGYISCRQDIQQEVSDDLIGLTIYEMNKMKSDQKVMSHLNAILNLYILNYKIFDSKKIRPIHIVILLYSNHHSHQQILDSVTQQLSGCLQDPKLLCQFKIFYTSDSPISLSKDPLERVDKLSEVAQNKGYSYSNQFLTIIMILIFDTKKQPEWSKVSAKARQIFDIRYLRQLVFPSHRKFSNLQSFFQRVRQIFLIYYQIYSQGDCPEILYLAELLDKLRIYHDQIQCKPCKESCYHLIIKMQIYECTFRKKYDGILEICLTQIDKLISKKQIKLVNSDIFVKYMDKVVETVNNQDIEPTLESNFKKIIYLIIKNNNCFSLVFISNACDMLYSFITDYIVYQTPNPDVQILYFHKQLTHFLHCYPQKQFVVFYSEMVKKWFQIHHQLLQFNGQLIISQFFATPSQYNCNFSLLLSYLLTLLQKRSPYFWKTAVKTCRNAEISIQHLKYCALRNMFSDLSVLEQLTPNIRKKRRLILSFIQYFSAKITFKGFMSNLGLKQLKKKAASQRQCLQLLEKIRLLYRIRS